MKGMIFDIQEMTLHDGPGARITFFMKGCPMRCLWCHNPEGQSFHPEIMFKKGKCIQCNACDHHHHPSVCPTGALAVCGQQMSVDEIIQRVLPLKETLCLMEGGVTFSGGEPCAQSAFLIECLKSLQHHGIHTAIETCGYCDESVFKEVMEYCDYIMMDLKLINDQLHQQMTGVSNEVILRNARILMNSNKDYCFRTPMLQNVTDTEENLNQIRELIGDVKWEKIPSNPLASLKYEQLKRNYPL